MGIEIGIRNSLYLFVYKSNFDLLKNKIDKEARKEFERKKKMCLTNTGGKRNKKKNHDTGKKRKVREGIR
jgi:predicted metal-dependent RNase